MKVLWVHSHFSNWMGGTIFIYELLKKLRIHCHLEIVVQNGSDDVLTKFKSENLFVHNLKSPSTNVKSFWIRFFRTCEKDAKKIQKIIDTRGFDTVVSSMFPANFIVSKLKNVNIFQYCYEPYAAFWDTVKVNNQTMLKRYATHALKFFFGRYDISSTRQALKVFTLSTETKEAIFSIYGLDSLVTYLGVDQDFYRHQDDPSLSQKYKGEKVLIHNTDFSPPKRTGFLLDSMPEIINKIPRVRLLITCSLSEKEKINRLVRNIEIRGIGSHVDVLGWVDYDLLPFYYSLADLVIYSGTSEGGGASAVSLFVLEAMACETPCLRSNDSKTEVIDGVNGELFNALNQDEFVKKCVSLLSNPNLLSLYSSRCRLYIEQKYSWDNVARLIFDNIKKIKT